MGEYNKKEIEIIENQGGEIIIEEKTLYKMDRKTIKSRLQNIEMHKEGLIGQSKEIKRQYDMLIDEENKLKESLKQLEGGELETI